MIKAICSSKSVHTQLGAPNEEPSVTYQATFNVSSECQSIYTKLGAILSKTEFDRYDVGGTYTLASTAVQHIPFRGSVTDLATDIAFELTADQGDALAAELIRFLRVEPGKFKS